MKVAKTVRIDAGVDLAIRQAALRSRRSWIGQLEWCVVAALGLEGVALDVPPERVTRSDAVAAWDRILVDIAESKRTGQPMQLTPRERAALKAVGGTARIGATRASQLIALRRTFTKAYQAWIGGTTDGKANS